MVEEPQDAAKPADEKARTVPYGPKAKMDEEALKSREGTLYPNRTIKVPKTVETGNFHTVSGSNYSFSSTGGYTGGYSWYGGNISRAGSGQTRSNTFSRKVPDTKRVLVDKEVPVKIEYPSPATVSHSQVLEQFFTDNLYKGSVPFQPDDNTVPSLQASVEASRDESTRANATAAYKYISEAERQYKEAIAKGEDKDKAALKVMKDMYESREGKPRLQSGAINASTLLLPLAQGTGTIRHYEQETYNGSAAQLFNYYMAVKRNEDKYESGYGNYSNYFAKASVAEYVTPPEKDRIMPSAVSTISEDKKAVKTQLEAALNQYIETASNVRQGNVTGTMFMTPGTVKAALVALKNDVDDGIIGNNQGRTDKLADLLDGKLHYAGREPTDAEAKSIAAVIKAQNIKEGQRSDALVRTPLTKDLAHDFEVAAKYLIDAKLLFKPANTATGLPTSMQPKPVDPNAAKSRE